ncbi:MAG TPA: biopolymer transporter ExbD [Bacteroidetes bacterium]|nr:biopolymer transporter ExbD [Bacteroidota bacterium]
MSRFKLKKGRSLGVINTSSLPDIIFILLFFFMVTVTMREVTYKVKINLPEATQIQKLEKKSLVSYIYVGPPENSRLYGTNTRIQLNGQFATLGDIQEFVVTQRQQRSEADRQKITTSLKVNKDTRMGIVTDIKQQLRKAGAFKINYSAHKKAKIKR